MSLDGVRGGSAPISHRPHRLAMGVCWFLTVFLVLFPKGGVKVGDVPITWGYMGIALSMPLLLPVRVLWLPLTFTRRVLFVFLTLLPMQYLFLYSCMMNGVLDRGMAISTFVNLFVLPVAFLLIYAPYLPLIDGERLSRWMRACMVIAALWGILLFILHPITHHFIEIPYLTVNAQDYGDLEGTKDITRGFFFKLISTYNNGNLYGTATLLLLPMYRLLEPRRWCRAVMVLALLLTLSRSVWLAMLFLEFLPLAVALLRQVPRLPVLDLSRIWRQVALLAGSTVLVLAATFFFVAQAYGLGGFLLDTTGGGRFATLGATSLSVLPSLPVDAFHEILYVSALQNYGVTGLLAFTLMLFSPALVLMVDRSVLETPLQRAALKGLLIYPFISLMDGGFNYLPIMAFYWFAYMIYLFGWPAPYSFSRGSKLPGLLLPVQRPG